MATYAIFGAVAMGVLAHVPGPPSRRARTLLAAVPAGCVLVTAGTLLAVDTWLAAGGMLVLGFAVAYAAVGGPRLVGLATGLHLFYMLSCFPPYLPETLVSRLIGLTLGVALMAAGEVLVWPDPSPMRYEQRLADTMEHVARYLKSAADVLDGRPSLPERVNHLRQAAAEKAEALRPLHIPAAERPASAGRHDQAVTRAASALRFVWGLSTRLLPRPGTSPPHNPDAARLLCQQADALDHAARSLTVSEARPPSLDALDDAITAFEAARTQACDRLLSQGMGTEALHSSAVALGIARGTHSLVTAVRIAVRASVPPDLTPAGERPGPFWYAYEPAWRLWWVRFTRSLTPRSVYFQSALRIAAALAVARLIAGGLDLSHGFWTLLATLTLMRTSAADTRTALRPALIGTLCGALVAAFLLALVGPRPDVYAALLPLAMLVSFVVGPILGLAWMQGLFTIVIAILFSQVASAGWQLAETRFFDVLIGGLTGTVMGLLAWPRGGGGEMRRAVATSLLASSAAAREAVPVLIGAASSQETLPRARHVLFLAEASYAQFQTERHDPRMAGIDWQAALMTAQQMVEGAETLVERCRSGWPVPGHQAVASLEAVACRVEAECADLAEDMCKGRSSPPSRVDGVPKVLDSAGIPVANVGSSRQQLQLVDVLVWLTGLLDDLARIRVPDESASPTLAQTVA
ncbi:FUSC family protein [Streptomyces sp. NPDC002730]|uniref:FUSC family protein n=1 Tax=Streptomyces sp. NPDC002730 TaxID=3364662 RepID=UPI003698E12C